MLIRATVDGELIPDTMLQPGQIKEIEATESVQLHLGNAGGVRIEYNERIWEYPVNAVKLSG